VKIVIVAEKQKAAELIAKALSNKPKTIKRGSIKIWTFRKDSDLFVVLGVKGHIFTSDFVQRIRKSRWDKYDPEKLLTDAPLEKVLVRGAKGILRVLRKELKDADKLIIATDYDREGENIGWQVAYLIAKRVNPKIRIKRAIFSSLTKEELRRAFKEENLQDLDMNKVMASETRQECDLRFGVAMTRAITNSVIRYTKRKNLILSLGPCQTPTLGLIVKRYLDHLHSIENARKNIKWKIRLIVKIPGLRETIQFTSVDSFERKEEAEKLLKMIPSRLSFELGEIKEMTIPRPKPLNTTRFAMLVTKYFKISSKQALSIAEKLYLNGLISYPRTETERFNPAVEKRVREILKKIIRKGIIHVSARLIKPSAGKKDDKAHPPIHPVKAVPFTQARKIARNGNKVYEFIVRHTLACFLPDAKMFSYELVAVINNRRFTAKMYSLKSPGFLEVYRYDDRSKYPRGILNIPKKGYAEVITKEVFEVKPPIIPPITESELIRLMEKLGIGTDATFADHIAVNIKRGYVIKKGNHLIPTEFGLKLAELLEKHAPDIINPHFRAKIEEFFSSVEKGIKTKEEAVKEAISMFLNIFREFKSALNKIGKVLSKVIKSGKYQHYIRRR